MNNINSIKRIRFASIKGGMWYGFSRAISLKEKSSTNYSFDAPIKADNSFGALTDEGRRIVNKLITNKGVLNVQMNAFAVMVTFQPIFQSSEFHEDIIDLINKTLFAGEADVAPLGSRREGEGLIVYSGTRKSTVRWYGVSTSLKLDDKGKSAAVISSPVSDGNWCGLTPAARDLVNTIFAMKGVYTIWVTPFDLSIEIAPVFSWSDYHDTVVGLIKDKIFDGNAFVEYKKD